MKEPSKRELQLRASYVCSWLTKLKIKAEEHEAIVFFEGSAINLDDIVIEHDYCIVKHSNYCITRIFELPDGDELLCELNIPGLKKYLEDTFKLYKEIKV